MLIGVTEVMVLISYNLIYQAITIIFRSSSGPLPSCCI